MDCALILIHFWLAERKQGTDTRLPLPVLLTGVDVSTAVWPLCCRGQKRQSKAREGPAGILPWAAAGGWGPSFREAEDPSRIPRGGQTVILVQSLGFSVGAAGHHAVLCWGIA